MAREDMHMHVEYLLTGSLAVCEVDVDSFAPKLGRPQCGCGELSYSEQRRSVFSVQIREGSSVTTRHTILCRRTAGSMSMKVTVRSS